MTRPSGPDRRGGTRPPRRPDTAPPPAVDQARAAALELLSAVRTDGAYANLALPRILAARGLSGRDAGLATDLAYGSCRAMGLIDGIIAECSDRPLEDLDGAVLDALRLGTYQLLRTRIPAHAAVSTTVDLVRSGPRPGAAGFANAILRKVGQRSEDQWVAVLAPPVDVDPVGHWAVATAHPRWISQAFADALAPRSDELAAALQADDVRPRVHLVARPGRITRDELVAAAGGTAAAYSPYGVYLDEGDPGRIAAVADGRAAVQDEGSQLVAVALANAPLEGTDRRWLDLAAGPGGKAGLLGALVAGRDGTLDAVEPAPHRADLVRKTVRGLPVTVRTADGRDPGFEPGTFDRVLLDAPCTGLGALRRRPEARWRRSPSAVAGLVSLQGELLASALRLVRVGGVVGYVTCSPHLAETEGVLRRLGDDVTVLDARAMLPGVPDLGDGPTVQLWPHRHGTDAMFLALIRRDA
ncbi:RsmB/NOP family class I SAM-dependent RNA methyltransferase [Nakamurella deserti]|uniref:RsmB/NOP family class I SAM-dependent RNA methyltransferase n=1 Tax=Nakamurella deserti TaxID=2164074 RepID=UPI000DBEA198|nr:transcription antitermination factor NusB [Nakamurella deserti]